ncbi:MULTISPECIES: NAD(P)/FAD-dependent oxidoreductase [unclassified Paenibacillus]|uniref:NAD(P)/FAD-dependent oxidoreductase n=1 Tax=unclassified Paenibacillus TaxID=185978 RepID=UPI001AEA2B41|nr:MULTISPECIES: NAD(P)/FAD-dependent oxidoreductase [unclassified Paenibacillus]MBP1155586.1 thioredoxin reductase [Paenibacillus sp. PvP091]MBP1169028.1 thioredoxin reductase [Paenibacillus sp. PvR098]MBP2440056.1 thioredoxin reductase [Paenibacillus sp. PvP052]
MYDIAVIGAGPAGATASLFAAKAGKKTLLIDNDKTMTKRAWVENHYGVMEITGPELVEIGKKQASKFGAEIVINTVDNITESETGYKIHVENQTFESKQVILATGALIDLAEKIGVTTKDGTEPRIKKVISVDSNGKTSKNGIWAAGTVAGVSVHTIITAGDGAKVAINAISELNGERYVDHDVLKS